MQINSSTSLYGSANLAVGGTSAAGSTSATSGSLFDPSRVVLGDAFARASDLGDSLAALDELISTAQPSRTRRALAASTRPLDLTNNTLTATTLRSTEEINNTLTSFSPFGPDYIPRSGSNPPAASTALPTISGVYAPDPLNPLSGTVTFEARKNDTHGVNNLRFHVFDPEGTQIDDIRVSKNDPIDQEYTVSNGLVLTLSAGATVRKETFEVEVYANIGSVVDPDLAFNGVRNDNPNLEYGLSVTDGDFDINGVNITVNAGDSINDVLGRISASAAGVTATFDVASEQVILTQNSLGSGYDISFANDTSGFLAATKLELADSVPGTDGNASTRLSELAQFAAVNSGTFRVNNVDIALDVAADSLKDVLERIESSGTHVLATLINDRLFLEATHRKDTMTLEDGATGLFDALNIREGRYKPISRDGIALETAEAIAGNVGRATAALERLLDSNLGGGSTPAEVSRLHASVRSVLAAAESRLNDDSQSRFGLDFDLSGLGQSRLTLLDSSELVTSLRVDFSALQAAFIGETPDARDGFVRQLLDVVNQFTQSLRGEAGSAGLLSGLSA